jgi:beta-galactosidase
MMNIVQRLDGTRPNMIEGDNRLLPKEKTEIESYHYNIDGTIAQWDRKRPLVFGEHGGWWYLCPQNSSAYSGLRTYLDTDDSSEGMAIREKIYVEYARRNEVTGITSFNFAHYMKKSLPDEDVILNWDRLDTPGCKPKVIRRHSLTINNGHLKNAPLYISNIAEGVLKDSYRPVVILPSEYNTSFYDGSMIARSFDVYNDTLDRKDCRIDIRVRQKGSEPFYSDTFRFAQEPGERKYLQISLDPPKVKEVTELKLEADLFHDGALMYQLTRSYKLYPQGMKDAKIDSCDKRIAYWGEDKDFRIIEHLLPKCTKIDNLPQMTTGGYDVIIIGSYINAHADAYQELIGGYVEKGGVLVLLEQFKFSPGDMTLVKQPFFSAHINDDTHRILKGLKDEDLIYWKPNILEDKPEDIVKQSFMKPVKGDINIILEASAGDFGDGGDLWTPLVEYGYGEGVIILNQLELMENYKEVPQACVLLRNILEYALSFKPLKKFETGLITSKHSAACRLFDIAGLQYRLVEGVGELGAYKNIIVDADHFCRDTIPNLSEYVKQGGNLLILPVDAYKTEVLSELTGGQVRIQAVPTYQLNKTAEEKILKGISVVDLFRFEKVTCSPRMVENVEICSHSIELQDGKNLLVSVTGLSWYDYFVRKFDNEFNRIALVDINRKNKQKELPYLVEKSWGKGRVIVSQISMDIKFEKNIRIYSRLLANLGGQIDTELFSYIKGEKDYSADYLMVLPHQEYQDYQKAQEYYTDREYSLNNLGEGLYGWMQKIEKNVEDGFICIPDSKERTYFITCFPVVMEDRTLCTQSPVDEYILQMDVNCSFKLWINGNPVKEFDKTGLDEERIAIENTQLQSGLNRLAIECRAGREDIRIRPVFKDYNGGFIDNIRYQLTIDEVDPK